MATLATLRTDLRDQLNEPIEGFWTNTELDRWLNEGLRDVARRLLTLRDDRSYTTVAEQDEYDMPEDMIQAFHAEYRRSANYIVPLEYATQLAMDDVWAITRTSQGTPYYWTTIGFPGGNGKIKIYPPPSQNINNGLRVYYFRLPRHMESDNDPADISVGWEDIVVLYAEVKARRKEAQDSRWREAQQLYEERLKAYELVSRQYSDQPNSFSVGGALPWWVE